MSKDMKWSHHTINWVPSLSPLLVSLSLDNPPPQCSLLGPQKVSSPWDKGRTSTWRSWGGSSLMEEFVAGRTIWRSTWPPWEGVLSPSLEVCEQVPGSSPGGSRVIRRWGRSRRLWKNTYLITDIERLEMDSVVGRLVEKRRLNNLDYME